MMETIFLKGSSWYDPRDERLYQIKSIDLLSATFKSIDNHANQSSRLLIDMLDMVRISESTDAEWFESDCVMFL